MKKHIFFRLQDKPANMGQSQLVEGDVLTFAKDRKDMLPNAKLEGNKLTFDVATGDEKEPIRRGYATVQEVDDDFQN